VQKHSEIITDAPLPMSKLVFKLRHVPDDEAEAIRQLLDEHEIAFFETFAGNWGISLPALWIRDEQDFDRARALIDDYQQQRSQHMRSVYEEQRQRGEVRTLWHSFIEAPLRFIVYVGLALLVLYFSVRVFLSF
jgi:hypothetical protein